MFGVQLLICCFLHLLAHILCVLWLLFIENSGCFVLMLILMLYLYSSGGLYLGDQTEASLIHFSV